MSQRKINEPLLVYSDIFVIYIKTLIYFFIDFTDFIVNRLDYIAFVINVFMFCIGIVNRNCLVLNPLQFCENFKKCINENE